MNVELPLDLVQFVNRAVTSGSFQSESQVLTEALRLLQRREQLRRDVNAGIEQLRRGECIELDDESLSGFLDDIKAQGKARLAEQASQPDKNGIQADEAI